MFVMSRLVAGTRKWVSLKPVESGLMMPNPDDNDWLQRLMFLGYGDWIGYVVAAIVSILIFGLYYLFTHL